MMLLEAKHLQFYVKDRLLLDIDQLYIHEHERIGLVGRNGSGKTTLLNLLAGKKEGANESVVHRHATCELLPQLKNTDTRDSGGEVTQAYINEALAKRADILLADEPTANLDVEHMKKLESQLRRSQNTFVIVSHDRTFLDALCTTIWEIKEGKLSIYKGNYSAHIKQKELEQRQQVQAYEQYEKKKRQLQKALMEKEQKAQKATKKPKGVSDVEARKSKMYFANKQKKLHQSARALESRLNQLEKVDKIREEPPIKMTLPNDVAFTNKIVLRAVNLEEAVKNRKLWKKVSFDIKGGDKVAVIGANGSGKTTLIKEILRPNDRISVSSFMKIGYFSQNLDRLTVDSTVLENVSDGALQDESLIRIILARLHFIGDDVYKKVHDLSGGERVKVAFAKLFVSDINTLILDEPTNFLDIETVEVLEKLLHDYEGTVIFASHDRRLIQSIANRILVIENKSIRIFDGTYNEYQDHKQEDTRDTVAEELLLLETRITEVLGKLSLEPSEALEQEFQALLTKKKALEDK